MLDRELPDKVTAKVVVSSPPATAVFFFSSSCMVVHAGKLSMILGGTRAVNEWRQGQKSFTLGITVLVHDGIF